MNSQTNCELCGKPILGKFYKCDVCERLFCSTCESFLSLAHVGNMNVGKVCPKCLNKNDNLTVIDPNSPRYFCKKTK